MYQIINANKDVTNTNKKITKVGRGVGQGEHRVVDPETGLVVQNLGHNAMVIGRMGDEKVSAFVAYHIAMTEMRQGVDKRNVDDLRARFYNYLKYCMEHGIMPNNMNCYYAIGVTKQEMSQWRLGQRATPEHQQFAEEVTSLFASIHEQAGAEQIVNPILSIYWSKAHDGLSRLVRRGAQKRSHPSIPISRIEVHHVSRIRSMVIILVHFVYADLGRLVKVYN